MDYQKFPKPPVIPSHAGAKENFALWLRENDYHEICDQAGLAWRLRIEGHELPAPDDPRGGFWRVLLLAETEVDAASLVRTGTLDPQKDKRLIGLLGDELIPLRMKPLLIKGARLEQVRHKISSEIIDLKKRLGGSPLHDTKRQLICRWLESKATFQSHL